MRISDVYFTFNRKKTICRVLAYDYATLLLIVASVYGQFLMVANMTVVLRHNCIIVTLAQLTNIFGAEPQILIREFDTHS